MISLNLVQHNGQMKLKDNLKPATHFIEVWKNGLKERCFGRVCKIEELRSELRRTNDLRLKTIAIFKIRLK